MKHRIFHILLILLSITTTNAQLPFKVITVYGEIVATKANMTLEPAIEVQSDEKFDFRKPGSRAALINSELGKVILREQTAETAFSKAAFAPAISSISARYGDVLKLNELKKIFSEPIVVIDKLELQIDTDIYPNEDNASFFINYTYNNENQSYQLPYEDGILVIVNIDTITLNGVAIPFSEIINPNLFCKKTLDEKEEPILIGPYKPVILKKEDLEKEVNIIINELNIKSFSTLLAETYDYVKLYYGSIEVGHLEDWLKNIDILKK